LSLEIYLIRHAESESNIDQDRVIGRSNWIKLTPHGIDQARALGDRFRKEGIVFDAIYSSPAVRARKTARHCFESSGRLLHPIELDFELQEISQGDFEGRLCKEVYTEDVMAMLDADNWNYALGDKIKGETPRMAAKRLRDWMEKKAEEHNDGRIFVSTHGMILKYTFADIFDLNKRTSYKIPFGNTSITMLNYENGEFTCVVKNDTSHLREAGLSSITWKHDDPETDKK